MVKQAVRFTFKTVVAWVLAKIDFKNRLIHGLKILIVIGVAILLLNIFITNTDKFWRWMLSFFSIESIVFPGFGLLAILLLAYLIALLTDALEYWVYFLEKYLPKSILQHKILKKIIENKLVSSAWMFLVRERNKRKTKLQKLMSSQAAIISPYSPWGMEQLGFIIGQVTFGKEQARRWRVAIPSPPLIFSGGQIGFIKDQNIIFLIKIPLPELINFYASYGIVSREHFEILEKQLYGIEINVKPENLPKVEEICNLESLKKIYGIME